MLDFEEEAIQPPARQDLSFIEDLCEKASSLKERTELHEKELKSMKESYRKLTERDIPQVLEDMGFVEGKLTLKNGSTLTVKDKLVASITKKNEAAAFQWLRDHQNDGIIKNRLIVEFPRGEEEEANPPRPRCRGHHSAVPRVRAGVDVSECQG